ncbi:heavy-metal-associated domain-containing protein [Saccharomonospora viridis]|jgi:copper chaperone|uniref:Copper chaperone n=2 Tax=Saccharomonospora viridis TaxID=1852 RepID=C7MR39_SACVD|nr:heavy metal-associated domain-containing protein [Saccharomonospora viridis]ACU98625.1 copper chaperone [Saccharomonospora viridis DSM 43017]KHF44413.1 copper chaperone [Saccharomonospora viridis]SFP64063.1 copper ion binding protein [Saccharomonospora viridis]
MVQQTYTVTGMTCEHCARSVREEVGEITGVTDVAVDVPTGKVTITSDTEIAVDDVRNAVEEAGYTLHA